MYIKSYSNYFKINESVYNGVLYHGSPYRFFNFKNKTTFFSDDKKFASDYSGTKKIDYGIDNDTNIYTVKCNIDFFDINDKKCEKELYNILPDTISYMYNNFGFTANENKDEFILNMKGFYTIDPIEDALSANVGDKIPSPEYRSELNCVYKKDEDYLYTYSDQWLRREMEINQFINSSKSIYKPMIEFIRGYIKRETPDIKYISDNHIHTYFIVFLNKKLASSYGITEPSSQDIKEFDKIYNNIKQQLIDYCIEKGYTKKFTLKTIIRKSSDSWRYYENKTIHAAIEELGYGGYIAKEKGYNTYAIFNPNRDIKIIKFEFPEGVEFNSEKEYTEYSNFKKKLFKFAKEKGFYERNPYGHINDYMSYICWKDGMSIEETYENSKKEYER